MKKIEIVIPTYNEAEVISETLMKLLDYCRANLLQYDYKVIVADNGSTDKTYSITSDLSKTYPQISAIRIAEKGRGRALLSSWGESKADVCCYMDADLSTDLKHLPSLIDHILNREFDIATGSRHLKASDVERGFKRRFVGATHIMLMKMILGVSFSDPYCGFKAASRNAIDTVFPMIKPDKWPQKGNAWFWDTEFLVIAENLGLKIYEEPVHWEDDSESKANILNDAIESIKGMLRLRREKPWVARL